MRNFIFGILLVCFLVLIGGCQTVQSVSANNVGEAIWTDATNTYGAIEKFDNWIQQHYW